MSLFPPRAWRRQGAVLLAIGLLALPIAAGSADADGDAGTAPIAETPQGVGIAGEAGAKADAGALPSDRRPDLAPDLQRHVDGIQARYRRLIDFKARFVQESRLQAASEPRRARGEVFYQKPGRMRWNYEAPDPQEILIRDGKFWQYVPGDQQVVIQGMDTSRVEYAFLTGLGDLGAQFDIRWASPRRRPDDPLTYLELVPKDEDATFASVVLGVDGKDRIVVTEVSDFFGNVTMLRFEGLTDNVGVAAERFQWKTPPGVEVIDMTSGLQGP